MRINRYEFMLDSISKFHKSLFLHGWFDGGGDPLEEIAVVDPDVVCDSFVSGLPHRGVESRGPSLGYTYQSLRSTDRINLADVFVVFRTRSGREIPVSLETLSADRRARDASSELAKRFRDLVASRGVRSMLDVGGRDRSKVDRSREFPNLRSTVLDILPGDNVDVVGDAHEMSRLFAPQSFDAVFSVSVFEHLAMPWKVAVEMNAVMKNGGIGYVHTHQTIGMHDLPWDFLRFSDSSWDGIFNAATGFRILGRAMGSEQYIIPFVLHAGKYDAEDSAGFESSSVMFEKISEPTARWDVKLSDILTSSYPA